MHNAAVIHHADVSEARIGPNALIQSVNALREQYTEAQIRTILRQCGQEDLLVTSPTTMVAEQAFADLVVALADQLGIDPARQILWRAGQLTAGYLLQHRIPRPFQWLLRPLPHRLALQLLLLAVGKHAWTFVGSGHFSYVVGKTPQLTVRTRLYPGKAVCGFYGGTFDHLIHVLIAAQARTEVTTTPDDGQTRCVYSIQFSGVS